MKFPTFSFINIVASAYMPCKAIELDWGTTVEAPATPDEPTQQQKQHVQAVNDQAITISGESVDIDVLSNDVINSASTSSLSLSLTTRGRNGYCVVHDDTDFIVYYPKHRYAGYDECEYVVCDQDNFCDSATVTITIVKALELNEETTVSDPDRPSIDEILDGLNITGQPSKPHMPAKEEMPDNLDLIDFNSPMLYSNDVALDFFTCLEGQVSIMIEVQADKYGDDTTWTLTREYEDGTSEVELSGGPYDANGFESQHLCAPNPSKWTFAINDLYGDGFCCKHGDGFYTIYLDNTRLIHVTHFADKNENVISVGYDPTPNMTDRDHAYLVAHNTRRKKWHEMHNVSYVPLQWSPKLAEMALSWANELLDDCDSSGIEHEPGVVEGENLAKNHGNGGWGQLYPPDNIVRRWVEFEETWPWPENAHLTQALWRASKYLGCGESVKEWRGGHCRVQVCRYSKSGNCDMGHHNTTEGHGNETEEVDWLTPMLALDSPCEPSCPPEGCY